MIKASAIVLLVRRELDYRSDLRTTVMLARTFGLRTEFLALTPITLPQNWGPNATLQRVSLTANRLA